MLHPTSPLFSKNSKVLFSKVSKACFASLVVCTFSSCFFTHVFLTNTIFSSCFFNREIFCNVLFFLLFLFVFFVWLSFLFGLLSVRQLLFHLIECSNRKKQPNEQKNTSAAVISTKRNLGKSSRLRIIWDARRFYQELHCKRWRDQDFCST